MRRRSSDTLMEACDAAGPEAALEGTARGIKDGLSLAGRSQWIWGFVSLFSVCLCSVFVLSEQNALSRMQNRVGLQNLYQERPSFYVIRTISDRHHTRRMAQRLNVGTHLQGLIGRAFKDAEEIRAAKKLYALPTPAPLEK